IPSSDGGTASSEPSQPLAPEQPPMIRRFAKPPVTTIFQCTPRRGTTVPLSFLLAAVSCVACSRTNSPTETPEPIPAEPVLVEPAPMNSEAEEQTPEPAPPEPMKAEAAKVDKEEKLNLDAKGQEPF